MNVSLIIFVILGVFITICKCDCNDWTDCNSCTSHKSWNGKNCRWCEIDMLCHAFGSLKNNCTVFENIDDNKYCGCKFVPTPGYGPEICSWYINGSIGYTPINVSLWKGGDFLPPSYAIAAKCACSGNSDKLWFSTAASCVRTNLIKYHIAIPDELKKLLRTATLSGDPSQWGAFAALFEDFHIKAYSECGCPGTPAPFVAWLGICWGGQFPPCQFIIDAILNFGRCGCGW